MIAIINGRIIRGNKSLSNTTQHNEQFKQFRYAAQRSDHKADILQPRDHNGNPNPDFIRQYPERAVDYFGAEDVKKYGNL